MNQDVQRVLVTGGAGSGGSYMLEHLSARHPNYQLFTIARNQDSLKAGNLKSIESKVKIYFADLTDFEAVKKTLQQIQPTQIYHFASNADVRQSFDLPIEVLQNNINCTVNIFEVCRQLNLKPRILMCSTSEVYGQVLPHEVPISENNAIRPASPYAVSKTTQDFLAQVYWQAYQIPIVRTRMFTYINPRRSNLFATSFAMQIVKIEKGQQQVLKHGNLNSVRTHMDIRDVARAYEEVMNFGQNGEVYNMGGVDSFTVGEFLNMLISKAKCEIKTELDPLLLRPVDVTLQIPNVEKFESITNWRPQYSLEESVVHLLQELRNQIKAG
jgi:GDP-4-dehydro-6-deoxy-D-mannose reductase